MSCDWNLEAPTSSTRAATATSRQRRRQQRVERECERLSLAQLRPRWSGARLLTIGLAAMVHLLTLAVIALAVRLAVSSVVLPVRIPLTAFLLGIGVAMRPRTTHVAKDARVLTRRQAPRLYDLLDEVAAALRTRRVEQVVLEDDVNGAYGWVGLRRRPTLFVGLPLWESLSAQARVAMLGHELGHGLNGDARHGIIVGSAKSSLQLWRYFLLPSNRSHHDALAAPIQLPFYWLATGYQRLLDKVDSKASQRAEYLADELSARVGSRPAAVEVLNRLSLATGIGFIASGCGRLPEQADKLRAQLAAIPAVEIERRLRVDAREFHSIDSTHPPTHLRLRFVRSRPDEPPLVRLSEQAAAAIEVELAGGRSSALAADRALGG
jgi:Zn-dependent protease with chaperone function